MAECKTTCRRNRHQSGKLATLHQSANFALGVRYWNVTLGCTGGLFLFRGIPKGFRPRPIGLLNAIPRWPNGYADCVMNADSSR